MNLGGGMDKVHKLQIKNHFIVLKKIWFFYIDNNDSGSRIIIKNYISHLLYTFKK